MKEEETSLLQFSYDVFKSLGKEKIIVLEINKDNDSFTIEIGNRDHADVDRAKEILKTLVGDINDVKESYSMDGTWLLTFTPPEGALDNYESKLADSQEAIEKITDFLSAVNPPESTKVDDEDDKEEEEEYDDRKGVKVVEKKGNVTVYEDGVIEIDLEDWRFESVDPEIAKDIRNLRFVTIMQTDWTRLVGYFLNDDVISKNEVESARKISGRWMFKGLSPTDEEYYFDIHDIEGSDVPHIYAIDGYGINELFEWFEQTLFKDKKPFEYTRDIELPNGTKEQFGIDKDGNPWQSWNRCPWLERLGL